MKKIIVSLFLVCIMISAPAAAAYTRLSAASTNENKIIESEAQIESLAFVDPLVSTEPNTAIPYNQELAEGTSDSDKNSGQPQIISETAVLIDAASGQVLFEKNMHKVMYPASITKILTALIAIEQGDMDQIITMSEEAVFSIERGSSHIALDAGEQITLEQALYGISIASGNDAANGIAEAIGGNCDEFAEMMNERAIEAGAKNSNFVNAHGLPDDRHYSTAYDMARIAMEAIRYPQFLMLFSAEKYEIPPTNKQPEARILHNANCFINGEVACTGIIAGKTGYTNAARHTLVSAAERNGRTLICVVMKSEGKNDKFNDTNALFDYGFEEFREITIPAEQIKTAASPAEGGNDSAEKIYFSENDLKIMLHQNLESSDVRIEYILPDGNQSSEEQASAIFRLSESAASENLMYYELAQSPLVMSAAEQPGSSGQISAEGGQVDSSNDQAQDTKKAFPSLMLKFILIIIPIIILFAAAVFWRRYKIIKHRQKIRKLREQYGRHASQNARLK